MKIKKIKWDVWNRETGSRGPEPGTGASVGRGAPRKGWVGSPSDGMELPPNGF